MRPGRETLFTRGEPGGEVQGQGSPTPGYRAGDAVGAWTEGLLGKLGMGLAGLASVAVPLALAWAVLGVWLGRTQQRIAARQETASAPGTVVPRKVPEF